MILIISTCQHKLHELEFVKPIEDILKINNIKFKTINYKNINKKELNHADKIIITGTSLADNDFIKHINKFKFIKPYNKPILGICAGMHILGLIYKGKLKKEKQIGLINVNFEKEFLGLKNKKQVYNLHGLYTDFNNLDNFEVYSQNKTPQAVKHKTLPYYGVLFHPEVRNKSLIEEFCKL
ncbi:hypothetical protein HYW74_04325 [Candidatus Pacearchaeota archaeon]|nr:hypothetical protein [Candidatus Pacearchaeota archaeon]